MKPNRLMHHPLMIVFKHVKFPCLPVTLQFILTAWTQQNSLLDQFYRNRLFLTRYPKQVRSGCLAI